MNFTAKAKRSIRKLYHKYFSKDNNTVYISKISRRAPWIFIAYIPDVFFHTKDKAFLNSHQNKREALVMVPILNKLGFNVYVQGYEEYNKLPNINVKIIFGHSPAIEQAARKYKKACVIKYATGCFYTHQNAQEKHITDLVNNQYGTSFTYERWVTPYTAHIIADKILMIGCNYTIETFPSSVQKKITTIHQSSQDVRTLGNIAYAPENNFFFMSSGGVLLRGVSFLTEYFSLHQEKVLHLVCPIEPYLQFVQKQISTNIILHGTLPLGGNEMLEIMSKCNYIIYPSGSDGAAGSVINSMKNGLIPIVSRWAAFDEINDYGYMMHGWDVCSIEEGITWSESITPKQCEEMKQRCARFAKETYNIDRFSEEFESFFRNVTHLEPKLEVKKVQCSSK